MFRHYPAVVDQILDDGTCTVIFEGYKNTEITQVNIYKFEHFADCV